MHLASCWEKHTRGCVDGFNKKIISSQSIDECKALCLQYTWCLAIEYGVDYGGWKNYGAPRQCGLQNSNDSSNCDGAVWDLDLYIKTDCEGIVHLVLLTPIFSPGPVVAALDPMGVSRLFLFSTNLVPFCYLLYRGAQKMIPLKKLRNSGVVY